MRNEYFFRVAGLTFSVILPGGLDAETLLPSFRPFRCGECPEGERIFRLLADTRPFADDGKRAELLDESSNDMGHVCLLRIPGGYRTEISYGPMDGGAHLMTVDTAFDDATAFLRVEDPSVGEVLSSMLRTRAGRRFRPCLLRQPERQGLPFPRQERHGQEHALPAMAGGLSGLPPAE